MPTHDAVERPARGEGLNDGPGVPRLVSGCLVVVRKPLRQQARHRLRHHAWEGYGLPHGRVRTQRRQQVAVELRDPSLPAEGVRYECEQPHAAPRIAVVP